MHFGSLPRAVSAAGLTNLRPSDIHFYTNWPEVTRRLSMLVLSRKESQRIRLGDSIVVTIVKISGDKVRVGIEAPADVLVLRDELEVRSDVGTASPAATAPASPASTAAASLPASLASAELLPALQRSA